ncbi:DUF1996 domain-containing protein [Cryptosporangium phraense]|uniref:DUF1996 domain-containing protein n=2 Tax=Cryptosporangium phraense TaxID=2593070 RepID=A0A545AL49_9ACTN|nr:DUF1996 domain-containing protein [Cryptosporangium phraense]
MAGGAALGVVLIGHSGPPRRAGHPSHPASGPVESDFVAIGSVPRTAAPPAARTFRVRCGNNENGHYNPDNMIVTPGIRNGSHHLHDYVGNTTTSASSTDLSLATAPTTCADRTDRSAYFWPVLRDRTGTDRLHPGESAADRNTGRVLRPQVRITFSGNPRSDVVAIPRFLRVIAGDAKAYTNGGGNAHAQFTCAGSTDRIATEKYPLCPAGWGVTRILEFPSCWDQQNLDSANHRAHVVYPSAAGVCPRGTAAIPKLIYTLTYDVPPGASYAVDSFPSQLRSPISDHADYVNVMSSKSTARVVACLNGVGPC